VDPTCRREEREGGKRAAGVDGPGDRLGRWRKKKEKRERRKRWAAEAGWAENRGGLRGKDGPRDRLGRFVVFFSFLFFSNPF
jgi:hypothetical protein